MSLESLTKLWKPLDSLPGDAADYDALVEAGKAQRSSVPARSVAKGWHKRLYYRLAPPAEQTT